MIGPARRRPSPRPLRGDGRSLGGCDTTRKESDGVEDSFEVAGDLDRAAAEALELELRRLARRYGIEIEEVSIEPVARAAPRRSA